MNTSEITKLVRQIEAQVVADEKASTKKDQQEFYTKIQESTDATNSAVMQMVEENRKQFERAEERELKR